MKLDGTTIEDETVDKSFIIEASKNKKSDSGSRELYKQIFGANPFLELSNSPCTSAPAHESEPRPVFICCGAIN